MRNWNILVVEDEFDGQQVVGKLLEYMGVQSDVAGTAEEAIDLLGKKAYTAAIIDLALPGMNGMELISVIRSSDQTASLPCVMVTAYHSSKVKKEALDAGFSGYFPKPIEDTTFIRELERLLSSN